MLNFMSLSHEFSQRGLNEKNWISRRDRVSFCIDTSTVVINAFG